VTGRTSRGRPGENGYRFGNGGHASPSSRVTDDEEPCVADNVYSKTEIVGSSAESIDEAIRGAVRRASQTLREVSWFEVAEIRGHVENGEVGHFQVTLKVGFALEDTKP
jgi:dodecin